MGARYLTLLGLLCFAVYTDMTRTKISNRLIVSGLILALIFRIAEEGGSGALVYMMNISIPVIFLYVLFQLHALGAGDIKLFSMIGAFISTQELVWVVAASFIIGAVLGLLKLLHKYFLQKNYDGKLTKIHFSPEIIIAYLINIWRCTHG